MQRIVKFRKKAGLSQADLAQRVGVSQPTVCDWENGEKVPTGDNLVALARELKVLPSEIIADLYDSRVGY